MKVELNLNTKKIAVVFAIVCIAFWAGFFSALSMNTESKPMNCLSSSDLNRSDIGASIILSRFCEGMGLQSSVLWQQDQEGKVYGLPICLQANG